MNIQFEGAREIKKPASMTDEQCSSAWAAQYEQELTGPDGQKYTAPYFVMCMQPSKEDIEAIIAGQPIWLSIMGAALSPHSLWTMNATTGEPNF